MKQLLDGIITALTLIVTDVLCIVFAFAMAIWARNFIGQFVTIPQLTTNDFMFYVLSNWWIIPLYVMIFILEGMYSKHRPFWQETKTLSRAIGITALLVYSIVSLGKIDEFFSRILFVLHPLILLAILPLARRIVKDILYKIDYWRNGVVELRVDTDYSLTDSFLRNTFMGYKVEKSLRVSMKDTLPGIVEKAREALKTSHSGTLLVIVKDFASPEVAELAERLYFVSSHILIVPELMDLDVLNADVYHLMYENLFVFDINKGLNNPMNQLVKRTMDIVLSLLGIIVFSPVLIIVSLMVFFTDGFPIFYDHARYGKNGKIFTFHKFRSMRKEKYPDENFDIVKKYVANDPVKKEAWEKFQKLENDPNDPRILPGMNIIRRTSVDELGQLFNILSGDMSVVGPRPFMPRERDMIGDYFDRILAAKPGITDLWTVSGRNSLSFDKRLKMGTWYIQNWSLWLDLVIIAKTIQQVILYFFKWSKKSENQ